MRCKILIAVCILALFSVPFAAWAQEAIIQGKITDENEEPLPGANVLIQLTNLGAAADINGNYKFTVPASVVRGQEVVLEARFIGYRTRTAKITLTPGTITQNFVLPIDVLHMDEIVVTGVVEETPKVKLAFSVGTVTSEALEQVPALSPESALYGKVAGVKVVRGAGQPGTPASVLLRAPTSINASGRSQDPLYIVDGVIIDPSVTGSPLTDIPAEDIESMEIVKGAAGASLYGSRASNGVIRITTRRGKGLGLNQTRIRFRSQFGFNRISKKVALSQSHGWKVAESSYTDANGRKVEPGDFIDKDGNFVDPRLPGARVSDDYLDTSIEGNEYAAGVAFYDNPYKYVATGNPGDPLVLLKDVGGPFDQIDRFFTANEYITNTLSVARNMENTNFLVSISGYQQAGIVDGIDGLDRKSVRLNLDHSFRNTLTLSVSGLYSHSKQDLIDPGSSSPIFSLMFMAPDAQLDLTNEEGKLFIQPDPTSVEDNPLNFIRNNDRKGIRTRIMGSGTLRWTPVSWFSLEGNLSYDRSNRNNENFWPIGFESITRGPEYTGRLELQDRFDEALNGSVVASFSRRFGDMVIRSKAQALFERTEFAFNEGDGRDLGVSGIRTLSSANREVSFMSSSQRQVRTNSYFFVLGGDYKDRYIADFLIRRDGSSLFGPETRWNNYFRVSGAWRLSQEPWWFIPALQEFKIRASYGTAGGRPNFSARFETWTVSGGNVSKSTLGNKALKPEFAQELELGVDMVLFDRFNVEFTYADTKVDDQLLFVPLPSFTGFTDQWRNAGTLETNTIELTLGAALLQKRDVNWTMNFTFDRTRQTMTKLDVPSYRVGPFFFIEGEVLGAMYGDKWITNLNDLPPGIPRDQFQVNDDGYVVWVGEGNSFKDGISKKLWGTGTTLTDQFGNELSFGWGLPIKYRKVELDENGNFKRYDLFNRLGDVVPDFNWGMNTTLNYKGFTAYLLLDSQIGGKIYNNTVQWGLRELKMGEVDQAGKPEGLKKPGTYYATLYNINAVNSHFVEDATYLKVREVRLSYTFGRKQLSGLFGGIINKLTIGVSGQNLFTFTGYRGFDPEVGLVFGELGSSALSRYDAFGYPNFRTFNGIFEIEF